MKPTTVSIKIEAPAACTAITFNNGGDGTLTITRQGTEISADFVEKLINKAAEHGILLVEVSQE